MNELVPDQLDEPFACAALARRAGVSPTTLANWAKREPNSLATVSAPGRGVMYTWRHLLAFCQANPNLHSASVVLDHYRQQSSYAPSDPANGRSSIIGATDSQARWAQPAKELPDDGVTLRSALHDLKREVEAQFDGAAAAAQAAQDVAQAHSALLRKFDLVLEAIDAELPD